MATRKPIDSGDVSVAAALATLTAEIKSMHETMDANEKRHEATHANLWKVIGIIFTGLIVLASYVQVHIQQVIAIVK